MSTAMIVGNPDPTPRPDMAAYLQALQSPKHLGEQKALMAAYDKAVDALIGSGDVVEVKERGELRQFKKKSAWAKLARHFSIDTHIAKYDSHTSPEDGHYYAEVIVRASAPWGQSTDALGACSTRESRFKSEQSRQKAHHDCLATAATRARNRAIADLIAQGEVSAEEIERDEVREPERQEPVTCMPSGKYQGVVLSEVPSDVLTAAAEWARAKPGRERYLSAFTAELSRRVSAGEPMPMKDADGDPVESEDDLPF
jgi:hypothetical protein